MAHLEYQSALPLNLMVLDLELDEHDRYEYGHMTPEEYWAYLDESSAADRAAEAAYERHLDDEYPLMYVA